MSHPKSSTSFTQRLAEFRQFLEKELEAPITVLDPSALLVLSDLCSFLEVDEEQVLGPAASEAIRNFTV